MHFASTLLAVLYISGSASSTMLADKNLAPILNGTSCIMRATLSYIPLASFMQLNQNNPECDCATPFFPAVTNCTVGITQYGLSGYSLGATSPANASVKVAVQVFRRDEPTQLARRSEGWVASTRQCGYDFSDANTRCNQDCSQGQACPTGMTCYANTVACKDGAGTLDGSCGNGLVGTGACADSSMCCSQWGYCGKGRTYCSTNGNDCGDESSSNTDNSQSPPESQQDQESIQQESSQQPTQQQQATEQQPVQQQFTQQQAPQQQPTQQQPTQQQPTQQQPAQQQPAQQQPAQQQPAQQQPAQQQPVTTASTDKLSPDAALNIHNQLRTTGLTANVGTLSWDTNLQSQAQGWANHLASVTGCALVHGDLPQGGGGQNLIMWETAPAIPGQGYVDAAQAWFSEGLPKPGEENPNHFIIMTDRSYKKLGCGYAYGNGGATGVAGLGNYNCLVVACNYSP
ncbi:CAP domain-containing protein [Chytriomyces sp. MP71]|nr:CAP domain-containing protein [Chytriomyces sp. MP71]